MKKKITLTESQLVSLIKKTVKKVISERYDDDYDEWMGEDEDSWGFDDEEEFADPGSGSALRAATKDNPRNKPCPTCGMENALTQRDVNLGYQCDSCADAAEGKGFY